MENKNINKSSKANSNIHLPLFLMYNILFCYLFFEIKALNCMVVIIIKQENKKYKQNNRIGIWGIFQGRESL